MASILLNPKPFLTGHGTVGAGSRIEGGQGGVIVKTRTMGLMHMRVWGGFMVD